VINRKPVKEGVMVYEDLSVKILDAVFVVHRSLGPGLLEACYHNALFYELKSAGLPVGYNMPFSVSYKGHTVGEYYADLVVDGKVVLELKSVKALSNEHTAQLLNYLHISKCRLGFLLNFQNQKMEFKRMVLGG
jgi:GxxExxY protein